MVTSDNNDGEKKNLDRHVLAAYLSYALEDLALINETSAALVRMAVATLNEETSVVPSGFDEDIDCK